MFHYNLPISSDSLGDDFFSESGLFRVFGCLAEVELTDIQSLSSLSLYHISKMSYWEVKIDLSASVATEAFVLDAVVSLAMLVPIKLVLDLITEIGLAELVPILNIV